MDSVIDSAITNLATIQEKRKSLDQGLRDLDRLCQRCEPFRLLLNEFVEHPAMLKELTETENELLYDLHNTIQNVLTFLQDSKSRKNMIKEITHLEFRLSYYNDLAQLNLKLSNHIEVLNLTDQRDLDKSREEDLQVKIADCSFS